VVFSDNLEEEMGHSLIRRFVTVSIIVAIQTHSASAAPVVKSFNQVLTRVPADPLASVQGATLDLNDDSIPDVSILHSTFAETGLALPHSQDVVGGMNGATILTTASKATSLSPGQLVDPAGVYLTGAVTMIDTFNPSFGNPAFSQPDVAIGVRIPVGGQNFYAWLGVQLAGPVAGNPTSDRLILHDYGYETAANSAVAAQAPEPDAVALLTLTAGLLLARRRP